MITEWDRYNNPSKGRYRDPEIELQNIKNSGDPKNKYVLSPFGFFSEKDEDGNVITKVIFPKEYERRYSKTDDNWLEICYNIIQCSANRHFWFLLTLIQKYQMVKFILKYKTDRLYKMSKADYTMLDLYCDLSKFQFNLDDHRHMSWIYTDAILQINQYKDVKYIDYGNDYFVLNSIEMWKPYTFDKIKDSIKIMDVENKNIYIHDGQYIINYQDPYGQRGR